jgi:hypothetical protein
MLVSSGDVSQIFTPELLDSKEAAASKERSSPVIAKCGGSLGRSKSLPGFQCPELPSGVAQAVWHLLSKACKCIPMVWSGLLRKKRRTTWHAEPDRSQSYPQGKLDLHRGSVCGVTGYFLRRVRIIGCASRAWSISTPHLHQLRSTPSAIYNPSRAGQGYLVLDLYEG